MLGTDKPIFIVGCTNTGTKCLFKPLLEHRDVGGLDSELHWLGIQPNIDGRINRLFALFPCFASNACHEGRGVTSFDTGPLDRDNVEMTIKTWSVQAPKHWKDGKRLLFKEPKMSLRMTWIKALWPDAIILGVVRNPWATAEGICRRLPVMGDVRLNLDIPTATAQWINVYATMVVESREIENFMWVRYEDLMEAKEFPVEVDEKELWSKILAHCELERDGFTMPNESKFSKYESGKNKESWSKLRKWEKDFISTATSGLLKELGYEDYPKKVGALNG